MVNLLKAEDAEQSLVDRMISAGVSGLKISGTGFFPVSGCPGRFFLRSAA